MYVNTNIHQPLTNRFKAYKYKNKKSTLKADFLHNIDI